MNETIAKTLYIYGFLTLLLILGTIFHFPLISFFATICALFFSLAKLLGKGTAFTTAIILPLSAIGILEAVSSKISILLSTQIAFMFGALIISSFIFAIRNDAVSVGKCKYCPQWYLAVSIFLPSFVTLSIQFSNGSLLGTNLDWLLTGDAQTNTVTVDQIIVNNGFPGGVPALSQGIMAYFVEGAIGKYISAENFIQLMQIQGISLALLWATTSVLFGIIVSIEFSKFSSLVRFLASLFGSMLPYSWYILGFSIEAGFYNAPLALISLSSTWIFWRRSLPNTFISSWKKIALLVLATIFALLAWSPLAAIPGIFLIYSVIFMVRWQSFPIKRAAIWGPIIFIVFIPIYATYLLPNLNLLSSVFASEGFMTNIPPKYVVIVLLFGTIVSIFVKIKFSQPGNPGSGLLLLTVGSAMGIVFLLSQGLNPQAPIAWYYYPQKMAWFCSFFVLFISLSVLSSTDSVAKFKAPWKQIILALGIPFLLFTGLMGSPMRGTGVSAVFPFLMSFPNQEESNKVANEISKSLEKRQIRLDFNENDFLVNQWVFQWKKFASVEPMWSFAYSLIQSPEDVCEAAKQWGGNVEFITKSESTYLKVKNLCADEIIFEK